jgi:hypothetical protein
MLGKIATAFFACMSLGAIAYLPTDAMAFGGHGGGGMGGFHGGGMGGFHGGGVGGFHGGMGGFHGAGMGGFRGTMGRDRFFGGHDFGHRQLAAHRFDHRRFFGPGFAFGGWGWGWDWGDDSCYVWTPYGYQWIC